MMEEYVLAMRASCQEALLRVKVDGTPSGANVLQMLTNKPRWVFLTTRLRGREWHVESSRRRGNNLSVKSSSAPEFLGGRAKTGSQRRHIRLAGTDSGTQPRADGERAEVPSSE